MPPQDAFLLRAQPQDGPTRLFVEHISDQFHAEAQPILERMSQQEQFCFSIDRRSLRAFAEPRVSDSHGAIARSYFIKARRANDFVIWFANDYKREFAPLGLSIH